MRERETFSSRLGFILISAGCAIGLGNVWRFPYIVGKYGGAAFVLIYLVFLVILGMPIMCMEFAVGRASRRSVATSFRILEPKGTKWHLFAYPAMLGNYVLMMFYTTVCGWMFAYVVKTITGEFASAAPGAIDGIFGDMLGRPGYMIFWNYLAIALGFGICSMGLRNGVEKVTKVMMSLLLVLMVVLCVRSVTLPGASEGLLFYLKPDFGKMMESGVVEVVFAAMSQAFFTLSIGMGSMAIFGSYIGKEQSLMGEALNVGILDTAIAFMSGLVIFPACFSFGVNPDSGTGLIFQTLPNIFNQMPGGRLWGALFFVFMSFAALSTVVAVFENIISFAIDLWGWERKKAVIVNGIAMLFLSLPCVLGFNLWSGFQPLGEGTVILDLEDFIVSSNILPLGGIVFVFFCTRKLGWGWKSFIKEADEGQGIKFPTWAKFYISWIIPAIILVIFVMGYIQMFGK